MDYFTQRTQIQTCTKEKGVLILPTNPSAARPAQTTDNVLPFFGVRDEEVLKNFFTVVTLRVFSLVFFSSNLEKGPRDGSAGCVGRAVAWAWAWAWVWTWVWAWAP